jgi:hypothetical protein
LGICRQEPIEGKTADLLLVGLLQDLDTDRQQCPSALPYRNQCLLDFLRIGNGSDIKEESAGAEYLAVVFRPTASRFSSSKCRTRNSPLLASARAQIALACTVPTWLSR